VGVTLVGRGLAVACACACSAACGAHLEQAPPVLVPIAEPAQSATTETLRFRSVELGRVVVGADPLTKEQADGEWHDEVELLGGKAVRAARITPLSARSETTEISYAADGTETRIHLDAYGVETYTDRLTPKGERSRIWRSGQASERGCARIREVYAARGLVDAATCLDSDGVVVADADGCESRRYAYDERSRVHEERCLAEDGKPATFRLGGQIVVYDYDERGYRKRLARKNADGAPAPDESGCVASTYERDRAGNVLVETCRNAAGGPHGRSGSNVVSTRSDHDLGGCVVEEASLDANGAVVAELGVAQRMYGRDAQCGASSLTQLDEHGNPAVLGTKVSAFTYVRNLEGLVVEERCRDAKGGPTSCRDASATDGALVRHVYDEHGREIERRGYTDAGAPSAMSRTYPHEWRFVYGRDGISNEVSYFDANEQPALANGTVAKHAFKFDRLGSLVSAQSFDVYGKPVRPSTGCSDIHRTYDAAHRLSSIDCLGTDGALVVASLILSAIHWPTLSARMAVERTDGAVVANAYYGVGGALIERVACGVAPCFR
jgi:hypothetical protein